MNNLNSDSYRPYRFYSFLLLLICFLSIYYINFILNIDFEHTKAIVTSKDKCYYSGIPKNKPKKTGLFSFLTPDYVRVSCPYHIQYKDKYNQTKTGKFIKTEKDLYSVNEKINILYNPYLDTYKLDNLYILRYFLYYSIIILLLINLFLLFLYF